MEVRKIHAVSATLRLKRANERVTYLTITASTVKTLVGHHANPTMCVTILKDDFKLAPCMNLYFGIIEFRTELNK